MVNNMFVSFMLSASQYQSSRICNHVGLTRHHQIYEVHKANNKQSGIYGYGSISNRERVSSCKSTKLYQDNKHPRSSSSCCSEHPENIHCVNHNEEDEMEIYGYRRSYLCTFITWLAIIATLFMLRLVFYWKPHWMLYCTDKRCPLAKARKVLLIDKYNQYFVERICYLKDVPSPSALFAINNGSSRPGHRSTRSSRTSYSSRQNSHNDKYERKRTISAKSDVSGTFSKLDILCNNQQVEDHHNLPAVAEFQNSVVKEASDLELNNSQDDRLGRNDSYDSSGTLPESVSAGYECKRPETIGIRFFENKKLRYIWDKERETFMKLHGLDRNVSFSKLLLLTEGLSSEEQDRRRRLYGENAIHVEVQSYFNILVEEVLGPFYIFQLFSITVWFIDDYYYYGTCIIVMSLLSLVSGVVQIRKNQQQLRDTVETVDYVKVCRGNNQYDEVESSAIVPGDVVVVPTFDTVLQFDAILLNGNVIVNESMLTGESVPITKTPLSPSTYYHTVSGASDNDFYDPKEHSKHTLFCGTKVVQTRYYGGAYVKALVIRVGFQTTKGELIRSIMFPKPVDFRFNKQIHRFVGLLGCLALTGFLYTVAIKTHRGATLKAIIISALDLITITVPPALPAAMTIGIIYAQSRLKKNKIFCISPRSINISGCINCVCFDKTGTLTEDHLSFNEVVPVIEEKCEFGAPIDETDMSPSLSLQETDPMRRNSSDQFNMKNSVGDYAPLIVCLAACHSLTIIDQKLIGDPLDFQMFEATGWTLEEPDVDDENKFDLLAPSIVKPPRKRQTIISSCERLDQHLSSASSSSSDEDLTNIKRSSQDVGILRQFPFSSSLQRMSVITRRFGANQFVVYSKGAPEKIASLCDPETVPDDFSEVLIKYTLKGFRVLALAYRPLTPGLSYPKMQRATRADIEKDLRFLGFLTLGNLLKPETNKVIKTLNDANIRSVMVTGDNMLTAISVARECHMISTRHRVALLQVDKKDMRKKDSRSRNISQDTSPMHKANEQTSTDPVVLNVEDIEEFETKLNGRSDNFVNGSIYNKAYSRPRLTWHYTNQECEDENDKEVRSAEGSVSLRFADSDRIHLALTGETWDVIRNYYPELIDAVCVRGTVFARMAPDQKQQLVEHLQTMQYYVGMCGDGANDSGALRSAHAGISLSDTEASVAAPFTSANANISCVPILICEGRAALVTAFGILKYMALYSLIQFCSVIILYSMYSNLTDMEFLYEDLFIITLFVSLFGRTEPHPTLDKKPPSSSLLSFTQLSSVAIQLVLVVLFQVLACVILWQQEWYLQHSPEYDKDLAGHDNYAVFAVSVFQYITSAIVFSKGKPYRKSICTNYLLLSALVIMTILTIVILIVPAEWNVPLVSLEVSGVPLEFRCVMVGIALIQFMVAMIGERFIVDHLIFKKSKKFFEALGSKRKGTKFEIVDRETQSMRWLWGSATETS